MPYKDLSVRKRKNKEYSRKHYLKNYAERRERINARRQELRLEWNKYKSSLSCIKCGFSHVAALDFHHTDPTKKDNIVSKLVGDGCFKRAREEAAKCQVLSANCHRVDYYEEKKKPPEGGFSTLL